MNVNKSIEKGRVIYNVSFWNKFWTLLLPVFLSVLLLLFSYFVFESNYNKPDNNWFILIGSSGFFIFVIFLIILYLKIDDLSKFNGRSRSLNKKLVFQFIKENIYQINEESNDFISVDIRVKFFGFSDFRSLTILFEGDNVYYNCVTFENVNVPNIYIMNFKSPLYWFANKNIERKFKNFLNNNS